MNGVLSDIEARASAIGAAISTDLAIIANLIAGADLANGRDPANQVDAQFDVMLDRANQLDSMLMQVEEIASAATNDGDQESAASASRVSAMIIDLIRMREDGAQEMTSRASSAGLQLD